jgi:anti-anti-sigma factor
MPEADVVSLEDGLSATVVSKNRVGSMTHFFPRGNLIGAEALDALREAIEESTQAREIQLIVDMVSVSTVNSKTLELLVDLHQGLAKKGGWIKLTNAKPLIRDIFRITGVDQIIDIVNSFNIDKTESETKAAPQTETIRLGELLVARGLLAPEKIEEAILLQQKTGKRLGHIVVSKGWIKEDTFLTTLAGQLGLPFI